MNLSISDIPRLFEIVREYGEESASREYVQRTFNNLPIKQARLPNYAKLERLCEKLNLVRTKSDTIYLTDLGRKLFELYDSDTYKNFNDFFIKNVVFSSEIGNQIHDAISKFYVGKHYNLYYPKDEIYRLFKSTEILPILYEVSLLKKKYDVIEINTEYLQMIVQNKRKISQNQLEVQLQNQKIIGSIAEEIVLEFERNRLIKEGHKTESAKIRQISDEFANAGYDIESFAEDKNGEIRQIFIEVKGSSGTEIDFHLSINELEKAKESKENYLIYFVSEINIKVGKSARDPIIIHDPYVTIFKSSAFTVKAEKYHIVRR